MEKMKKPKNIQIPEQLLIDLWSYHLANIRTPELDQRIWQGLQEKYDAVERRTNYRQNRSKNE